MLEWLTGTPYPFARKVIVNCKDGTAISGVLWQRRAGFLVLRNATVHRDRAGLALDGEALIFKADVSFIQVLPNTAMEAMR